MQGEKAEEEGGDEVVVWPGRAPLPEVVGARGDGEGGEGEVGAGWRAGAVVKGDFEEEELDENHKKTWDEGMG